MNRKYRSVFLWSGVIVIILGIGYGMIWLVSSLSGSSGQQIQMQISDKDYSTGPSNGDIVLVEYSDFQCPACAAWNSVLQQLKKDKDIKDELRIIYRFFPLSKIHLNAEISAQSAYAAGKQNKFWEYHDVLFEKQSEWSSLSKSLAQDRFIAYAESVGISLDQFIVDANSSEAINAVQDSYREGLKFGVNSTPTFFVNGLKLRGATSYEDLKLLLLSSRATPSPK